MNKKSILVMVSLLVSATFMASMAYTRASVTNASTLSIVDSTSSLISLVPVVDGSGYSSGHKDKTVRVVNGNLAIDFNRGYGNGDSQNGTFGIQQNSVYEFDHVFDIKNNSKEDIQVKIVIPRNIAKFVTLGEWSENLDRSVSRATDYRGLEKWVNPAGDTVYKVTNNGNRLDWNNGLWIGSDCKSYYALPSNHTIGLSIKVDTTKATVSDLSTITGQISVLAVAVPDQTMGSVDSARTEGDPNPATLTTPNIFRGYWKDLDTDYTGRNDGTPNAVNQQ